MTVGNYAPDGKSGNFPNNGFYWNTVKPNHIEIKNSNSDIIYRGKLKFKNNDLTTIYIKLSEHTSNKSDREISVQCMGTIPDDLIDIEDNKIKFSPSLINKRVQIVEIPHFNETDHDTDFVLFDKPINSDLFFIDIEKEELYDKDFVIWIGNNCKKYYEKDFNL